MRTFEVTFDIRVSGRTFGYTMRAEDEIEAIEKCRRAIDQHGHLDIKMFQESGGDITMGMLTVRGDCVYELHEDSIGICHDDDEVSSEGTTSQLLEGTRLLDQA